MKSDRRAVSRRFRVVTTRASTRSCSHSRLAASRSLRAFHRAPGWQALGIGAIGFAGMFAVFSYLAPTMLEVTRVSQAWIPLGLAGFGVGGVIGNFAGG